MVPVGAVEPDRVGRVDLDGENTGAQGSGIDRTISGRAAGRAEVRRSDGVAAAESELYNIAIGSGDGAWIKNISSIANGNLDGSGERTGSESKK